MRVCSECCLIWKLNRIYKSWWAVQTTASVFTGLFRMLTITAIRTRTLPFRPAVGVPEIAVWRIARNAQRAPIDRCVCNLCIANWFSIACEFTRELKQTNKCGENKKKKKNIGRIAISATKYSAKNFIAIVRASDLCVVSTFYLYFSQFRFFLHFCCFRSVGFDEVFGRTDGSIKCAKRIES